MKQNDYERPIRIKEIRVEKVKFYHNSEMKGTMDCKLYWSLKFYKNIISFIGKQS